jgi:hypothetical protein
MTYDELVSSIKAYLENDFPETAGSGGLTSTEQVNTFIRQAEQRIFNTVQLLALRKNVVGQCTQDDQYLKVPLDWLANYSIAVVDSTGRYEYLLEKDVNFIRESFPDPRDTGKPSHYAYFNQDAYILGPTPDQNYTMELHYFYYPESIVDCECSWLGDNFDSVLLYGALLEAATFIQAEPDMMTVYRQRYDESLALLKQLGDGKNRQDAYRSGQARYPVM